MKIRKGFVSNSSSSSFTCDVCGETAAGFDISLTDFDMWQCQNDHISCDKHFKKNLNSFEVKKKVLLYDDKWHKENFKETTGKDVEKATDDEIEKYLENDGQDMVYEMRYELPIEFCPCCIFETVANSDIVNYLFKREKTTHKKLAIEMKNKFKNYSDYKKWLSSGT